MYTNCIGRTVNKFGFIANALDIIKPNVSSPLTIVSTGVCNCICKRKGWILSRQNNTQYVHTEHAYCFERSPTVCRPHLHLHYSRNHDIQFPTLHWCTTLHDPGLHRSHQPTWGLQLCRLWNKMFEPSSWFQYTSSMISLYIIWLLCVPLIRQLI